MIKYVFMIKKNISIDSDGVISDFMGTIYKKFGGHPNSLTFTKPCGTVLKADAAMWAHVETDPDFWLDIPFFDYAHDLIDMCRGHNVRILTGCPSTGYDRAVEQKTKKLGEAFGIPVITCLSKDKAKHLIAPGDILIDDMPKNIKRWEQEKGIGIRFRTFEQASEELRKHI